MEHTCQSNIQQQMQHSRPIENIGVSDTIIIVYTFNDILYVTFNKNTENKQIQILPLSLELKYKHPFTLPIIRCVHEGLCEKIS